MNLPGEIADLCRAFQAGLEASLGDNLYAAYIYGAAAFPGPLPLGDVDFHVIVQRALTSGERAALEALHADLARGFGLGGELDGYYILLADARRSAPPTSQMWAGATDTAWALHCAHVRAGRCIVLHGPPPRQVYPPVSWPQLERALQAELDYVQAHAADYPAYGILNLCRLMYSFETRDVVVSKAEAARWAGQAFPEWRPLIERARGAYARPLSGLDRAGLCADLERLVEFACDRIQPGLPASSPRR